MIFCLSQLHTGTQTSLAWLCKHDEVDGMMLSTGVHKLFGLVDPADTVHDWESGRIHERFSEGMVYHEHLRCDRFNPYRMNRTQLVMATIWPGDRFLPHHRSGRYPLLVGFKASILTCS